MKATSGTEKLWLDDLTPVLLGALRRYISEENWFIEDDTLSTFLSELSVHEHLLQSPCQAHAFHCRVSLTSYA